MLSIIIIFSFSLLAQIINSRITSGSCLEEFQLMPFMQCSSSDVCRHGVRTDKSFWLAVGAEADYTVKPMTSIDEIEVHISRCRVCLGTKYVLTRHSFTDSSPECPNHFHKLWEGYSYLMVRLFIFPDSPLENAIKSYKNHRHRIHVTVSLVNRETVCSITF